jgi:hypothetical protein
MASTDGRSIVLTLLAVALVLGAVYLVDPTFFGLLRSKEGFEETMGADANYASDAGRDDIPGAQQKRDTAGNPNSMGGDNTTSEPVASGFVGSIGGFVDASGAQGFADASGEGFADLQEVSGPAAFGSAAGPAGCYPRDQLTPSELLPKDPNSVWAQQNPMGTGSLKGKNFLSAGALIGVNTVGQSLRNANLQLRSEPPNPQVPVTVFNNSTIEPDTNRRDMEIN